MSKAHAAELIGDIRDCASRARDMGFVGLATVLNGQADELEYECIHQERPSSPILMANIEARETAAKHFQEARRLLRDIKR